MRGRGHFSILEGVLLIRANLSSIPLYLFSLFSIQLSVAEMVEKIIGVDEGGRDHLLWKVC